MEKKFYIINTSIFNLPLNGTHILSNRKFAKGFEQNGYKVVEILSDEEVEKIENVKGNIIILSSFIDFKNDWNKIVDFGKKYDQLFYILWCWHWCDNPPFKYWVHTFQEYKFEPTIEIFKNEYKLFKNLEADNKFIPYRFSSYVDPKSNFKELNKNKSIDLIYIGCSYEMDKINVIQQKNYNSFINISGGGKDAITGEKFSELYRKSKICLGFMAEENNQKNTITERIWEAFSFGCLVLTNSKCAEIVTKGVAVYYTDTQDLLNKIDFYLANEEERNLKIEKGYDIFTSYGNYKYNANEFIKLMQKKINLIYIFTGFHTASTFINHKLTKYLNKKALNLWDLKNEKIEDYILKTHCNPNEYINYINKADILIIPFRKKSKILQTGYFQDNNFNINTDLNINKYKYWLNKNHDHFVFNYDYVLNIVKHFSLKLDFSIKCYNIFNINQKYIIIIDTQNSIPDDFFEEIYKIYYGKEFDKSISIDSNICANLSIDKIKNKFCKTAEFNNFKEIILNLNLNQEYDDIYYKIINNFKK